MAIMKVQLNRLRISPQKVRLVADVIRQQTVAAALTQLDVMEKRSAAPMAKLLRSAVSNAQHNLGIDEKNLFVSEVMVGEGTILKRWLPRAHGRATKLYKRTSHITLSLTEIQEGKNRTQPEQVKRMEDAAKRTKSAAIDAQDVVTDTQKPGVQKMAAVSKPAKTDGAAPQKMFRRKSS